MNARTAAIATPNRYLRNLDTKWQDHLAPRCESAPTVVSLFSGVGSSLGYSFAGYREILAVDQDKHAICSLALNFPEVEVYCGDICGLSTDQALHLAGMDPGELDLLDGSPPCQGFSLAGSRVWGDPRNELFKQYVRMLRAFQPKVFVMENVTGLVCGKMKLIFAEMMRELKASGYKVSTRQLNSKYLGVPQSRERVIFIGVREDLCILPSHPLAETSPIPIRIALEGLGNHQNSVNGHIWIDESPSGRNTKTWHLANKARQGQLYAGQQRRQRWDYPADTLTTGGMLSAPYLRGLHCHPLETRTFSVREMARLASFPDNFRFAGEWFEAIKRIGNCVPPLMMEAIARHIRIHILDQVNPASASGTDMRTEHMTPWAIGT